MMMNLVDDKRIFIPFCDQLYTHLRVLDFIYKTREIDHPDFDPNKFETLILPVEDEKVLEQLRKSDYVTLVKSVLENVRILESCMDIFRSEMDDELIAFFAHVIRLERGRVQTRPCPQGFSVECSCLISDLILPVLSRLHTEILTTFDQFMRFVEAVGGDTSRLFLNAKGSTPTSQFIQMWVANELGIPPGSREGFIFVV